MKVPYEKGVAIRSAPSFALGAVKCPVKRKQGKRWAGYRASKIYNQGAGRRHPGGRPHDRQRHASCWSALRSRRSWSDRAAVSVTERIPARSVC